MNSYSCVRFVTDVVLKYDEQILPSPVEYLNKLKTLLHEDLATTTEISPSAASAPVAPIAGSAAATATEVVDDRDDNGSVNTGILRRLSFCLI